ALANGAAHDVPRAHVAGCAPGTPATSAGSLLARLGRSPRLLRLLQSDLRWQSVARSGHDSRILWIVVDACPDHRAGLRVPFGLAELGKFALEASFVTVLDRYIVRSILGSVLLVMSVLLVLGGLFIFIEQQDDIGVGRYNALSALWFTLLNLPQQAYELLPITALMGSLLGLGSLARGSELVVVRTTGLSTQRIAGAAAIAGLILIGVELLLGEVLGPPLHEAAKEQKAFSKFNNVSFGGGSGAWVHDGTLIINVARQSGQRQFSGMQIFELSADHRLRAIGHAGGATAGSNRTWLLTDYAESRFTPDRIIAPPIGQRVMKSNITAGFLGLAVES